MFEVDLSEVQARLDKEAAKFNVSDDGLYRFNNIRRFVSPNGANWTANYGVRGRTIRPDEATLKGMRDALERVQNEMPQIRFENG